MVAKKQKEIKQELEKKKKEGDDASKKAVELANFAEKTKATFENFKGEATAETAQSIERVSQAIQSKIEGRYNEAVEKSKEIDEELEQEQKGFEKGAESDKSDIAKLKELQKEAKAVGVNDASIAQAEKSKQQEISFLDAEAKDVEKAQGEMKKKLSESKQRRQAARFNYKSKNTLGS
ncbi:MAG: hypothetical protein F6K31_31260 [Symploca sp. SIO2G7]|nr:hypothetical protein [Symploca sp. SIO2G7]